MAAESASTVQGDENSTRIVPVTLFARASLTPLIRINAALMRSAIGGCALIG